MECGWRDASKKVQRARLLRRWRFGERGEEEGGWTEEASGCSSSSKEHAECKEGEWRGAGRGRVGQRSRCGRACTGRQRSSFAAVRDQDGLAD